MTCPRSSTHPRAVFWGGQTESSRWPIGKRHSQDFVVGVRLGPFEVSVSVPLLGRWELPDMADERASFRLQNDALSRR